MNIQNEWKKLTDSQIKEAIEAIGDFGNMTEAEGMAWIINFHRERSKREDQVFLDAVL